MVNIVWVILCLLGSFGCGYFLGYGQGYATAYNEDDEEPTGV